MYWCPSQVSNIARYVFLHTATRYLTRYYPLRIVAHRKYQTLPVTYRRPPPIPSRFKTLPITVGSHNNKIMSRMGSTKSCQEWDLNPCPYGPVPETGALDQLGHLDIFFFSCNNSKSLLAYIIHFGPSCIVISFTILKCVFVMFGGWKSLLDS